MSNPDLVRLASESMKNMRTDDFKRAAQQLNQTRPEEMLDMTEKIANANPEEFAAMKAQADAQISYVISGAKMLKQQVCTKSHHLFVLFLVGIWINKIDFFFGIKLDSSM